MARVDFYVLSQTGEQARLLFACRLAEKVYRLDNSVYIHAPSQADAARLDDLLWTFRDGSFVPHEVVSSNKAEAPVTIGALPPAAGDIELLINLADDIPANSADLPRIAEIVSNDESSRQLSRQRYARYRELGHTLETHKL